ncbi:PIN domain-containing protein [Azospirillum halopraeferens]|uniref:PIN domain-containing protein n=1 Tax=Azospirillum halopraeferens TaxID=34010 RepID=UPI00041CE8BB|nr:PIN domain-containing protein [Azospirillum halopraeferens]
MDACRLVVDTNVFVAAGFKPHSAAAAVLAAVRDGRARLVWDAPTQAETRAVLTRIPRLDWDAVRPLFRPEDAFPDPTDPASFTVVEDPGDRKFAALAAAAGAVLVTNDADLLSCRDAIGVRVLTPREALADLP